MGAVCDCVSGDSEVSWVEYVVCSVVAEVEVVVVVEGSCESGSETEESCYHTEMWSLWNWLARLCVRLL